MSSAEQDGGRGVGRTIVGVGEAVWPAVGLMVLVGLAAALIGSGGPVLQSAGTGAFVNMVLVVGLFLFVGNSGVLSFGHIAFAAVGAYTSAILTLPLTNKAFVLPHLPGLFADAHASFVVATLVAAGIAGVLALIAAVPLMRLSGIAAGIATFALLIIVQTVTANWTDVTGGLGTLTGVPTDLSVGGAAVWAMVAIAVAFAFQTSRFGKRLRASRDDDVAARALGVKIERERRLAFVLSAMVMGAGGSLYAHRLGAFGPNDFYIDLTFLILAMLIIGGTRSLAGAVVGTGVLSVINEVLTRWQSNEPVGPLTLNLPTGTSSLILSLLMLLILIRRPDGITGSRELRWPLWRRRRRVPEVVVPTA